jgi:hypothetical protein
MYDLVECRITGFTGQQRLQTMLLDTGELMPLVKQARETNAKIQDWQGWCLVVETSTTPRRVVYPIEARA